MTPEAKARIDIDKLLTQAGWHVCGMGDFNIHAAQGVAIREFPLNHGFGFADYLLYVNGKACGVIEAKKAGATLSGVEVQSGRYAQGLPASLPAWHRPLPFLFESTGVETHFTNGFDPQPRARGVFAFFRPELLSGWLAYLPGAPGQPAANDEARTFLHRLRNMPQLVTEWGAGGAAYQLWPAQITAIKNLEKSLAANKPKALIQMATGSGKTFTSISFIYRLIKFAGARRVLFLVDRGNLARQTKKEFDQYASRYNNFKFGEEYIVQHLQSNQLDTSARVVICTIQRMFSMLKGRELPPEADEESTEGLENLFKEPEPSLSEADRADMLVFLSNMLGMLPVMGVHAFEQPAQASAPSAPVLTCKGKGVTAKGYEASQGFVVKAGSQAVVEAVPSMLQHARSMFDIRQELIGNGVLVRDGVAFRFSQDYAFSAPSTAAAVVLGRSANGRIECKDALGRTLKELQAMEAGA